MWEFLIWRARCYYGGFSIRNISKCGAEPQDNRAETKWKVLWNLRNNWHKKWSPGGSWSFPNKHKNGIYWCLWQEWVSIVVEEEMMWQKRRMRYELWVRKFYLRILALKRRRKNMAEEPRIDSMHTISLERGNIVSYLYAMRK